MKFINSIKWFATWLSMSVLKRSLQYRIEGDGASWLQPVVSNKPAIFNRVDFILEQCRNKKVLHIGFTDHPYTTQKIKDGSLLHLQLQKVAADLVGMDVDKDSIRSYKTITGDNDIYFGDIMIGYPSAVIEFKPGLILLSEVLEHLTDPYKAVELLYESFSAGTAILVTVPNYTSLDSLAASLNKNESIHPHHHWYFSPYTLRRLLDDKRFHLEQLHFGMYYQPGSRINLFLKNYPFNGDCIIALFTIIKNQSHA